MRSKTQTQKKTQKMNRRIFIKRICKTITAPLLLASYSVFIERILVQINHYQISVPALPKVFTGFKLAHLTDLHLGPMVSVEFIKNIVKKTNQLKADAIACTGDFVNAVNSKKEINRVWPILLHLSARYGVFSVLGNHDHWSDTKVSLEWLKRSGHNCRHKCRTINKEQSRILIGGTGDLWEDTLDIDQTFSNSNKGDCRILLTHNPDAVDTHFKTPIALTLAGHTHGGQIRVPFYGPLKLPVKNKHYTSGLIQTKKTKLFISRGIGWSIYPVRFNCYPEIAVLTLIPE